MKAQQPSSDAEKPKHQLTEKEEAALRKQFARSDAAAVTPKIKVVANEKGPQITIDHPDRAVGQLLLQEALGSEDDDFVIGLLQQLAALTSTGNQTDEHKLNFLLSIIKGVEPKDQLETMLAAQMAAVHMASMTLAGRLNHARTLAEQDSAERAVNKLARTFTTQMEALKRYRTGGEQSLTVEHALVQGRGQSTVRKVTQAPSESTPKTAKASTPALANAGTAPKPINNDNEQRVVVPLERKKSKRGT